MSVAGTLGATCIGIPVVFLFALGMAFLGLLRILFVREAALEGVTVGESFQKGWSLFRSRWNGVLLTWLILLGIGIAVGIALFIAFFILLPVYLILLIPAILLAAIPGFLVFGITSLFSAGPVAVFLGILFALPLFFTVTFSPLVFLSGLYRVYESAVWTLAYREMKS